MLLPPAGALIEPAEQPLTTPGVAAICSLLGNVSVKLTTCAGRFVGGFVKVKVKVDVPPGAIVVGLNALVRLVADNTVVSWVTLLLAVFGSVVELEALTVAVLVMVPVALVGNVEADVVLRDLIRGQASDRCS
jgi:hypothetical protein